MRNPLIRRYPRELRAECGKYLAIFLFMVVSIGFISGFLVADGSMIAAYNNSFEDYTIEDGHFRTGTPLNAAKREAIEALGLDVYDLFYVNLPADNGSTVRVYPWREDVDRICVMQGKAPAAADEIAVDRMWADNNGLAVGDTLTVDGAPLTISALVAFSDYSCLFESNGDMMFDAVKFTAAAMTEEGFEALSAGRHAYNYAYLYQGERPADERAEVESAKALAEAINKVAALEDFVPRVINQAITFTGEDMGSDRAMMLLLLYILIGIMAFVFAMTAKNTIYREAGVIGTLRASGYTRGELLRHYILLPILVTLLAALVGNALGYTVFKYICVDMYYGSYSLPTYVTVWNADAFLLTSVVPIALMLAINALVLRRALGLSPIRFLRHDLSRGRHRRAVRLSEKLPFLRRFRARIILQNRGSFLTLLIGILFANILLYFGLMLPVLLDNLRSDIVSSLPSRYQYILSVPEFEQGSFMAEVMKYGLRTSAEGAEPCCVTSLQTEKRPGYRQEEITVYGLEENSAYIPLDFSVPGAYVSEDFADKYQLKPGDTFNMIERFDDGRYTFTVAGTCHYPGMLAVFLSRSDFNGVFGKAADDFNGYFSDEPIEDIDSRFIAGVIDINSMTKVSRQLQVSMGGMMYLVDIFSVILFMILMYLLTKLIIEKNARSISMVKILGGTGGEIASLYLASTAIATVISVVVTIPLAHVLIEKAMRVMMASEMTGWLPLRPSYAVWGEMALLGVGAFAVVALLEYRRILRVPMDAALKNVD